ncbi:MAG: PLP-dependent aminotransferase family protein [Candidatus Cloacimonetes bacterium]|nr:PLP-dependent aminotransferase family protein [Candidatus Cloacimonadota bacterium]NLO12072.1 PLP-dependent aminotransferase family protein [Candidatus Cloacimonadota bacterium]
MNYAKDFSRVTQSMGSSMIRELVASTKNIEGLISFAGGFPAPATFPKDTLAELYKKVVQEDGYDVLQYGASEGDRQLKAELIKWEGYPITPEEMLITVGATNAIYLYSRALLDPGDVVICEAPTFLGSLVVFDSIQAELVSVPINDDGISIQHLEAAVQRCKQAGKRVKFIYTIPDFHNPGGVTMSMARRRELIAFAIRNEIGILEDNPYSRLRFSGEPLPTLYQVNRDEFAGFEVVTEVVSFSKILGPGMRMSFAKGAKSLIAKMESWQQKVNVTPDCVSQRVVARFLADGHMEGHLKMVNEHYAPYLKTMLDKLEEYMPEGVKWTKPQGGIFVWLELPKHISADDIFPKAAENKVSFIPGSKFYPVGQEEFNTLRLNFTFSSFEQIDTGIRRLAELLKAL